VTSTEVTVRKGKRPSPLSFRAHLEYLSHDVIELLSFSISELGAFANWRLVRSIAELQILTRASYVMLVLVPILAGIWPLVRSIVNQHNKHVAEISSAFNHASQNLSENWKRVEEGIRQSNYPPDVIKDKIEGSFEPLVTELTQKIERLSAEYTPRTLESPDLPRPLAASFLAALAVVIAHTIYQMFAPEMVRRMTLEEFVASQKDDFGKHPTPSAVYDSKEVLRRLGERRKLRLRYFKFRTKLTSKRPWRRPGDIEDDLRFRYGESIEDRIRKLPPVRLLELKERAGLSRSAFTNSKEEKIDKVFHEAWQQWPNDLRIEVERQVNMSFVSQAAQQTYINTASQKPLATVLTAAIYGAAIYMICSVLINQTSRVLQCSEITSAYEVLEWWIPSAHKPITCGGERQDIVPAIIGAEAPDSGNNRQEKPEK
jgi:hypothetical protein